MHDYIGYRFDSALLTLANIPYLVC